MITSELIKQLRDDTGAGVMDAKRALEEFNGDYDKAKNSLMEKGLAKAEKKSAERTAKDGLVFSYIHNTGKVGSLVLVACETDFVAKTDGFKDLCKDIALQVCNSDYTTVEELVNDEFIKDSSKTISTLINEAIAKLGEKIEVRKFVKFSIND